MRLFLIFICLSLFFSSECLSISQTKINESSVVYETTLNSYLDSVNKHHISSVFIPCTCNALSPLLPGAQLLIGSFDITQMATNMEREEYNNPFRSPVFAYTFVQNRCTISSYDSVCYRVPDQLFPYDIDIVEIKAVIGLYTSSYEYTSEYSESYTCSAKIGVPEFSASASYHYELYESEDYLTTSYVQQGVGHYREYLYGINLPPAYALLLDPIFNLSLADLPSLIESETDDNMYNLFLTSYGGYFLTSGSFGGRYDYNQYVNKEWCYYHSEEDTTTEMTTGFNAEMFSMTYGYSSNSSEYITSEDYQENSNVQIYCRGGDPGLACGSQEWQQSIVSNPAYLTLVYAPMDMLVYDDDDKQSTLRKKIYDYTTTGIMDRKILDSRQFIPKSRIRRM